MTRWFRFYSEALNDPKVQRLDGETFKFWVNALCLACENEGRLPPVADLAFAMRMDENGCLTVLERLLNGGLIDRVNGGPNGWHYAPHGWAKRQYKSDGSTERVKRFRERSKAVTETGPDTDTDTDTDTETPIIPLQGKRGKYAFQGKVARLTTPDYDRFRKQFHAIGDFDAELTAFDGWVSGQTAAKQRNWYGSLAPWLNKRHQENLANSRAGPKPVAVGV